MRKQRFEQQTPIKPIKLRNIMKPPMHSNAMVTASIEVKSSTVSKPFISLSLLIFDHFKTDVVTTKAMPISKKRTLMRPSKKRNNDPQQPMVFVCLFSFSVANISRKEF